MIRIYITSWSNFFYVWYNSKWHNFVLEIFCLWPCQVSNQKNGFQRNVNLQVRAQLLNFIHHQWNNFWRQFIITHTICLSKLICLCLPWFHLSFACFRFTVVNCIWFLFELISLSFSFFNVAVFLESTYVFVMLTAALFLYTDFASSKSRLTYNFSREENVTLILEVENQKLRLYLRDIHVKLKAEAQNALLQLAS